LTPAAGKRLIAQAVATLPEVVRARDNGRLAVANGTTTGFVVEELLGEPLDKFEYSLGVVTEGTFAHNPDAEKSLAFWCSPPRITR
jgi:hypothetical protein